ncbi:chemotaxis protein CheW [Methylobacterium sp. M6A4_1b]
MTQTRAEAPAVRLQALRAERSRLLARRGRATAEAGTPTRAVLVCACGDDRFALALSQVAQVLPARPVTPLPGAPPAVLGLIAISGRVVSLIALGGALGRGMQAASGEGHVVLLRGGAVPVALAVDRVLGVAEIAEAAEAPAFGEAGLSTEAVSGYAPPGAGPDGEPGFVIVDVAHLLRRYLP